MYDARWVAMEQRAIDAEAATVALRAQLREATYGLKRSQSRLDLEMRRRAAAEATAPRPSSAWLPTWMATVPSDAMWRDGGAAPLQTRVLLSQLQSSATERQSDIQPLSQGAAEAVIRVFGHVPTL